MVAVGRQLAKGLAGAGDWRLGSGRASRDPGRPGLVADRAKPMHLPGLRDAAELLVAAMRHERSRHLSAVLRLAPGRAGHDAGGCERRPAGTYRAQTPLSAV